MVTHRALRGELTVATGSRHWQSVQEFAARAAENIRCSDFKQVESFQSKEQRVERLVCNHIYIYIMLRFVMQNKNTKPISGSSN